MTLSEIALKPNQRLLLLFRLQLLMQSAQSLGHDYHEKGTYLAVEGPRFSSVAESKMFQSWGTHVIGMTAVLEVRDFPI